MKRYLMVFSILLIIVGMAGQACAACSVATTAVSFGLYDVFWESPIISTGSITVICDESPPPTITISIGPSPNSGVFLPRRMKHQSGQEFLDYNLFIDSSRSVVWGDGTQGTSTLSDKVHKNRPWIVTIYGQLPAGQDVRTGNYSETLTVTISR